MTEPWSCCTRPSATRPAIGSPPAAKTWSATARSVALVVTDLETGRVVDRQSFGIDDGVAGGGGGTPNFPLCSLPSPITTARSDYATGVPTSFVTSMTCGQLPVSSNFFVSRTSSISTSAMFATIQSKFSCPTEWRSASGAQFMKSMA